MSQPRAIIDGLILRDYRPADQQIVEHLYNEGLLEGQITPNDTGVDIEDIPAVYQEDSATGFWVAELDGQVLGMIGVVRERQHTAEVRRLRVAKSMQNTNIGGKLIEHALWHCSEHGYLKVVLDTRFEKDEALDLFDRYGFQHTRTKSVQGKDLLEFYLDLYRDRKDSSGSHGPTSSASLPPAPVDA